MRNRFYFFLFGALFSLMLGLGIFAFSHTVKAATIDVTFMEEELDPEILTINVGDTVRWTNDSEVPHQIASDPHPTHGDLPSLGSGVLNEGQTYSYTFQQAGEFGYHDHLNFEIGGLIIVEAPSSPNPPPPPPPSSGGGGGSPTPVPPPPPPSSGGGGGGSPAPSPTPSPTPTPSPAPYLDGTLLLDGGVIYVMEYGKKRPFASMTVFTGWGYKLSNVIKASTAGIVQGEGVFDPNMRHVRGAIILHNGTVYFVGTSVRYAFPSAEIFLSWGLNFKDLVNANAADVSLPLGPLMHKKP